MKVIIVGAGLGGLACAIACCREHLDVLVLERAPEIASVGAGIQIPPNGARVLRRLGVMSRLLENGTIIQSMDQRRYEDGSILTSRPLGQAVVQDYGEPWLVIHREDYYRVLYEEARRLGTQVRLSSAVTSANFNDTEVVLSTGEVLRADVVVVADGLWSTLRPFLAGELSPPIGQGAIAYRATISRQELLSLQDPRIDALCAKNAVTNWLGPGKHSVFYPVKHGEQFNLVLLGPDDLPAGSRTGEGNLEEIRAAYENWDETLSKIVSCVPFALKWKICYQSELEKWTRNHFAIIGDACHASLPFQAQGASLAVEDGAVLGRLLGLLASQTSSSSPTPPPTNKVSPSSASSNMSLPFLLDLYEALRKPRVRLHDAGTAQNSVYYHLQDGPEQRRRDELFRRVEWSVRRDLGRCEWTLMDGKYQQEMLGYDVLEEAERMFQDWLVKDTDRRERRIGG